MNETPRTPHRLLLVVAHPDDETFGCGSLLAHASACGVTTVVACATRGEAGSPAAGSGLETADMATVRERELRAAANLLGVSRVELFEWRDSDIDGEPAPGSLVAAALDEVAARVATLIDEFRPTVVVVLDASDGHRDHAHIRDATLVAVDRADWPVERVYLHCLPQRLMRQWVAVMQEQDPASAYLALGELGTPDDRITTVVDTGAWLAVREQAISLHRSQISPYAMMPAELRHDFLAAERLCRVRPAWSGGPIETSLFPVG